MNTCLGCSSTVTPLCDDCSRLVPEELKALLPVLTSWPWADALEFGIMFGCARARAGSPAAYLSGVGGSIIQEGQTHTRRGRAKRVIAGSRQYEMEKLGADDLMKALGLK